MFHRFHSIYTSISLFKPFIHLGKKICAVCHLSDYFTQGETHKVFLPDTT